MEEDSYRFEGTDAKLMIVTSEDWRRMGVIIHNDVCDFWLPFNPQQASELGKNLIEAAEKSAQALRDSEPENYRDSESGPQEPAQAVHAVESEDSIQCGE